MKQIAYLHDHLAKIGIFNTDDITPTNYLEIFKWLYNSCPSIGYNPLYDLYIYCHKLSINTLDQIEKNSILAKYKQLLPSYVPLKQDVIDKFMSIALEQARLANLVSEIPIGCVIVKDEEVIATGHNQNQTDNLITSHAEIVAINKASKQIGSYRLNGYDLYVTIEPCLMCIGAIMQSRINRVIFGAPEPKTGAIISQYQVLNNWNLNKYTQGIGPINSNHYATPLINFLKSKR